MSLSERTKTCLGRDEVADCAICAGNLFDTLHPLRKAVLQTMAGYAPEGRTVDQT